MKPEELFSISRPLIDVRAPVEFADGHLPGAVNLPLLNDDERAQVGTTYKKLGREAAVELGHRLVSGDVKAERIKAWTDFLRRNPDAVIYCYRGGMRSQIAQQWSGEICPRLEGGYKAARNFLLNNISQFKTPLLVISGATGSGKTELLWQLRDFRPVLDLEGLANHRGSAFGNRSTPQPAQATFENHLSLALCRAVTRKWNLALEDESRLIGRCVIPEVLFEQLRASPVVWVDEPVESRVEHILKYYVAEPLKDLGPSKVYGNFKFSMGMIQRKLGGLRTSEVMADIELAESDYLNSGDLALNRVWIEKLLRYYYDPLYLGSLERRKVKVEFKGSRQECFEFLKF